MLCEMAIIDCAKSVNKSQIENVWNGSLERMAVIGKLHLVRSSKLCQNSRPNYVCQQFAIFRLLTFVNKEGHPLPRQPNKTSFVGQLPIEWQ